ncbi:MAG: hypothetical protein KDA92_26580, partial [Planctomycetales bacterium]|nr:hypothetical protein [Planctomycetales bacterium]
MSNLRHHFRTFIRIARWWKTNVTSLGMLLCLASLYCLPQLGQLDRSAFRCFWVLTSVLVTTIWLNRRQLRDVTTHVEVPQVVYCGEPTNAQVELNTNRYAASTPIALHLADDPSIKQLPHVRCDEPSQLRAVPTVTRQVHSLSFVAQSRGVHRFPSIQMSTDFPLGVFRLSKAFESHRDVLVLPTYGRIQSFDLQECIQRDSRHVGC